MKNPTKVISILALGMFGCAIGPRHIANYDPKKREFDPGDYDTLAEPENGSLFAETQVGWFEDNRAKNIGDIIVIRIDERETATRSASAKLGKDSEVENGVSGMLGLMGAIKKKLPDFDPSKLYANSTKNNFKGKGEIQRQGRLNATLPVRIRKVMPNGDFFIEGTNVVLVSNEEHHLYVSGVVRRIDVQSDNTVFSSRVADAEIEYVGRGDVSDYQRPGWLNRAVNRGYPF
jgi:flagellar L-ring protein precursor FlgH